MMFSLLKIVAFPRKVVQVYIFRKKYDVQFFKCGKNHHTYENMPYF